MWTLRRRGRSIQQSCKACSRAFVDASRLSRCVSIQLLWFVRRLGSPTGTQGHGSGSSRLGAARISLRIDVATGDAIHPTPATVQYPTLLDDPPPLLRAYPRESVIAEKFEAIVDLGFANSRLKDYYDLHSLLREAAFDLEELKIALGKTFARRGTPPPDALPVGLSKDYAAAHAEAWNSFLERIDAEGRFELREVVEELEGFFAFLWQSS